LLFTDFYASVSVKDMQDTQKEFYFSKPLWQNFDFWLAIELSQMRDEQQ